jgi:hypothetical protein
LSKEREKFKQELEELQAEMKEDLAVHDEQAQNMIRESREELNHKLIELERDRADLKVSLQTMYTKKLSVLIMNPNSSGEPTSISRDMLEVDKTETTRKHE